MNESATEIISGLLASIALLLLAVGYVVPVWIGGQPVLTYEQTVVLMLLNIGTLVANK